MTAEWNPYQSPAAVEETADDTVRPQRWTRLLSGCGLGGFVGANVGAVGGAIGGALYAGWHYRPDPVHVEEFVAAIVGLALAGSFAFALVGMLGGGLLSAVGARMGLATLAVVCLTATLVSATAAGWTLSPVASLEERIAAAALSGLTALAGAWWLCRGLRRMAGASRH